MTDKKISINLMGCCAIRDIFGLHDSDGGYHIQRYVQCVSPISAVAKSPLLRAITDNDEELFSGTTPFFGRCQILELEKHTFEYLAEESADYLIIDAAEFRRKLIHFPENDSWFSENYNLSFLFERYRDSGLVSQEYELLDPMDADRDMIENCLKGYCDKILSLYDPSRIILVEIKAGGHSYIDDELKCEAEEKTATIFNERMGYAFTFFQEQLKGAHVIEFPKYVSIDPNHKWGRNLLHYGMEYYDYALKSSDLIMRESLDSTEERNRIAELKKECEEKLYEKGNNLRDL